GKEIIERMREYLRGGREEQEPLLMGRVIGEALELARPRLHTQGNIRVQMDLRPAQLVHGNGADLRRALANLILNAVDAMPTGGVLNLKCYDRDGCVMAEVADTGSGISLDDQKRMFSPYFTTKETGTGLGLVSAKQIVERHGGELKFQSQPGNT